MREPLDPAVARKTIRRVLSDGFVVFTRHAREEMRKDGLDELDVRNTLRGGLVAPAEYECGGWRYRCRAREVTVVVELESDDPERAELADTAVVVTAWSQR